MIRTFGEPVGNTDLPVYLAGHHGDAGHLTVGNDFLQAKLAVAENGDKSDKHGNLSLMRNARSVQPMQSSCQHWCLPRSGRRVLTGKSDSSACVCTMAGVSRRLRTGYGLRRANPPYGLSSYGLRTAMASNRRFG